MPGRHGYSTQSGWAQGGNGIGGVPATLSISSRVSNTPSEYRASESIEFVPGFESGTSDSFETFITQDGGSTGSGSGGVYAGGGYRYGFNGKEQDPETYGDGNQYDYGFRIYNPRLGRFLSVDPLFKSYPWYTPYQFAGNMPIWAVDLDGLEEKVVTNWITIGLDGKTIIKTSTTDYKDYGGGVGPLGKGTLVTYNIDRRQAVNNPDYKKNGLSKTLNLPGPIEAYSVFTPAPDADKATRKRGGLWFTSSSGSGNGGGPAGELDPGDGEPINIDLLISAAGSTGLMEDFSRGGKGLERFIGILENIGKISEAAQTGIEIKNGVNEYLEKKAAELPDPNVAHCKACGKNYVIENGQTTWTETPKQAGDTTESHGAPLKSQQKSSDNTSKK